MSQVFRFCFWHFDSGIQLKYQHYPLKTIQNTISLYFAIHHKIEMRTKWIKKKVEYENWRFWLINIIQYVQKFGHYEKSYTKEHPLFEANIQIYFTIRIQTPSAIISILFFLFVGWLLLWKQKNPLKTGTRDKSSKSFGNGLRAYRTIHTYEQYAIC